MILRHLYHHILAGFTAALALPASAASLDSLMQKQLSQSFVTANVLTNGDAIRLGFWSFDPNEFVDLNNDDLGNEESAQLRQEITTLSLPYEWTWGVAGSRDEIGLLVKAAYIDVDRTVQIVASDDPRTDKLNNTVISLSSGAAWRHYLDDHWRLSVSGYLHWMRFQNHTDYRNPDSKPLAPMLNGLVANITVQALLAEPGIELSYELHTRGGTQWRFFSDYYYLTGDTFNTDRSAHDANPEAWYTFNGVQLTNPLISHWLPGQNVWFRAARVDLGADLSDALGNHYYYEAGIAWLVDTGSHMPLLDNIGIGLNFNYGSVLRGGSLVLLLNEF